MIAPASDWCQRWNTGSHSWRHTSEGGFDKSRYDVEPIPDDTTAKAFVLDHHYSGSFPLALLRYGLYDQGTLVGVAVLSGPQNDLVLTNVFPDLDPRGEAMELGRLVLLDAVPANAETWFVTQAFRLAAGSGVRGVVSFADPQPRTVNGRVIFPGHIGTIYQAKNALYCGRATKRTLWVLPDGTVPGDRMKQKIRKQERGHEYAEKRLISFGARPMRAGEKPAVWMNEQLREITRPLRHSGNHRYVFTLGSATQRRHVRVAMPAAAYPKHRDPEVSP